MKGFWRETVTWLMLFAWPVVGRTAYTYREANTLISIYYHQITPQKNKIEHTCKRRPTQQTTLQPRQRRIHHQPLKRLQKRNDLRTPLIPSNLDHRILLRYEIVERLKTLGALVGLGGSRCEIVKSQYMYFNKRGWGDVP